MTRYKEVKFKKFEIDDPEFIDKKYKLSFGLTVDSVKEKKMQAVYNLDNSDISTDANFQRLFLGAISDVLGLEVTHDNCFIIPVCIYSDPNYELRIYKVSKAGVVSLIATPVSNWAGGDLFFYRIKDTIFLSDCDSFYKKSTNGGVSWSNFTGDVWYGPLLFNDDYYYTPDGRKRTQDGLTWENFISITDYPFKVSRLVFYRGFFYGLAYNRSNSYTLSLVRFNSDLTWDVIETFSNSLGSLSAIHSNMEVFDDRIIIGFYGEYVKIYAFDGSHCDLLKEFSDFEPVDGSDITRMRLKVIDENNLAILVSSDSDHLYRDLIMFNGKDFFHTNKGSASVIFLDVGKIGNTFMILVDREYDDLLSNATNYAIRHDYNKKFFSGGFAETEIIDEGEIVPKQIILKHDPLPANTLVNVYVRKNKISSWGSILFTFNGADTIRNVFSFLKTYGSVDFLEFKIELVTSDNVSIVTDISLDMLYLPIGLVNSK